MTQHAPADTRRRQILDAARSRFIADGFAAARMSDIARDAGLSKGGVYFHFDSKRALFDALIESEFEAAIRYLQDIRSSDAPIAHKLEVLARHYLDLFSSRSELLAFRVVARDMALRDAELQRNFARLHASYRSEITRLFAGSLPAHITPEAAALLLKALMDGLENVFVLNLDVALDDLLSSALNLLLHGLVPQTPRSPS